MSHTLRFARRCLDRLRQARTSQPDSRAALADSLQLEIEDESFFDAAGDVAQQDDTGLEPTPDSKLERKRRPEVRARRARLTRYVQGTLAALVMLCVLAFAKLVAAHGATVHGTVSRHTALPSEN